LFRLFESSYLRGVRRLRNLRLSWRSLIARVRGFDAVPPGPVADRAWRHLAGTRLSQAPRRRGRSDGAGLAAGTGGVASAPPPVRVYLASSRIALPIPSIVSGYMRSSMRRRTIAIDCV